MIKVFLPTEKEFETNGEIVIDAIRCAVKNAINGDFSLEMTCSVDYNDYVVCGNILCAPTPQGDQPFRIYDVEKNPHKITAKAKHITFDAENYLLDFANGSGTLYPTAFLEYINRRTILESPFVLETDTTGYFEYVINGDTLHDCIKILCDKKNGYIVRDKWKIKVLGNISHDKGITIEYGKNMLDMSADYDFSNVVTTVFPIGNNNTTIYGGSGADNTISSVVQYDIPYAKYVRFDQDIDASKYANINEYIAAVRADLRVQGQNYVDKYCTPSVNYTLQGRPEKVSDLGDVILVRDRRINIEISTQVIAYEYDAIGLKYNSLEFGNFVDGLKDLFSRVGEVASNTTQDALRNYPKQIYPVGSYYTSSVNISPGQFFGGQWRVHSTTEDSKTWYRYA